MTSRYQSAREETEENKKSLKIVIFDSQVSLHSQCGCQMSGPGSFIAMFPKRALVGGR